MAEFLTTTGISNQLEQIIKNANDRLVIVSPYLKTNTLIRELLEEKERWKIDIRVIYGKENLQPGEKEWLESMTSIRTSFCRNLHAKCYLNEDRALLTSMNLYEFSQMNNREMGLLINRENEPELYQEIDEEVRRIIRASEDEKPAAAGAASPGFRAGTTSPAPRAAAGPAHRPEAGPAPRTGATRRAPFRRKTEADQPDASATQQAHCIRCKETIPFNPKQPYCRTCFTSWKRFENGSYEEKNCHLCGKEHSATMLKPLCAACFGTNRNHPAFSRS